MTLATSHAYLELCAAADRRAWRVLLVATGEGRRARVARLVVADREGVELAGIRVGGVEHLELASRQMLEHLDELDRRRW